MELLIYVATLAIGYLIWIKIKSFFTGRTMSEQMAHDDAREKQRVCRNCRHNWGNECLEYNIKVDRDRDCCGGFKR